MSTLTAEAPRLVHALPGRVRIHVRVEPGQSSADLEAAVDRLPGVRSVQANMLTGNVLVRYDPAVTNDRALLSALHGMSRDSGSGHAGTASAPSPPGRAPRTVRARILVPGMNRQPHQARRVAEHLASKHPNVRSRVSLVTGRVLVEFDEHEDDLDNLFAELTGMDLPDTLDDDEPDDPLDPGPLVQSAARTAGATLGLTLITSRRLANREHPIDTAGAVRATAVVGVLSGLPLVRNGARRLFGRDVADILLSVPAILGLALSDSPIGLLLSAAEGVRLLSEVMLRRASWRRFEERLADAPAPVPGTVARIESGERAPLAATVLEGFGTATGRDGLPTPVTPGSVVPAGARLYGGSFDVELETPRAFQPVPRPAPVAPTLYSRYTQLATPVSLAYAALTGLFSLSPTRALEGLLLLSPRTAVIGMEAAEIGASARVLRAGVTNVGTRRHRTVQRPHVLLLDGPRVLTDGFELADIVPLSESWDAARLAAYASAIAVAAGSPWGSALRTASAVTASDGAFDGGTATASIAGVRYTLGPLPERPAFPATARTDDQASHVLQLREQSAEQPLGYLRLRQRLAQGATELVETCHRHGVSVEVVVASDPAAARAVAGRVAIPVLPDADAPTAIRARQAQGQVVAFLSDHASAAEGFAAADLAIGIADPRAHLPARADLVAVNLSGVAAIVEAGARAELGTRGSVVLSIAANSAGALWGLGGQVGLELASESVYLTSLAALVWDWLVLRGGRRLQADVAAMADGQVPSGKPGEAEGATSERTLVTSPASARSTQP